MHHSRAALPLVIALAFLSGCSDNSIAPDMSDGWEWSQAEAAALATRAEAGDIEAADNLLQYYIAHDDEAKIAYWYDWLFRHGDPGAVEYRAHQIHSAASKRADGDPRKVAELREAERLWLSANPSAADNYFAARMRSEIVAIDESDCRDERAAGDSVGLIDSWSDMERFFEEYRSCDDGYIAEGVSERVGLLLLRDPGGFTKTASTSANGEFKQFVVRHVDETLSVEDLRSILAHSENCDGDKVTCRALLVRASSALRALGEPVI